MTLKEAIDLSVELGRRLSALTPSPDIAIGLANGALLTTRIAATEAALPHEFIKIRRKGSRLKQKLVFIKRFLRLPAGLLAWHPIGLMSRAFDRRFGRIEEGERPSLTGVAGKTVLIIDDCIDTGSSIRHLQKMLSDSGAKHVHVAVLCWSGSVDSKKMNGVVPDIYLHRRVHYYPWSNNSPYYQEFLGWLSTKDLKLWE